MATSNTSSGKSIAQLQAERMAETRFTDMMAAAGVDLHRVAQEMLYWMPKEFCDAYQAMVMEALRGTDGGSGERGKLDQGKAELGRAAGTGGTASGGRGTARATGRKYKKHWVVQDEELLELKEKIDKRLRSMARDMRRQLEAREDE